MKLLSVNEVSKLVSYEGSRLTPTWPTELTFSVVDRETFRRPSRGLFRRRPRSSSPTRLSRHACEYHQNRYPSNSSVLVSIFNFPEQVSDQFEPNPQLAVLTVSLHIMAIALVQTIAAKTNSDTASFFLYSANQTLLASTLDVNILEKDRVDLAFLCNYLLLVSESLASDFDRSTREALSALRAIAKDEHAHPRDAVGAVILKHLSVIFDAPAESVLKMMFSGDDVGIGAGHSNDASLRGSTLSFVPPALWTKDKYADDSPVTFIQRNYMDAVDRGLSRIELRGLDPELHAALVEWGRDSSNKFPADWRLQPGFWARNKGPGETPPDFIKRAYAPWLGKGLSQAELRQLDPSLYMALHNWLRRNEMPADLYLPSRREQTDHLAARYGHPSYKDTIKAALESAPDEVKAKARLARALRAREERSRQR